MMMMMISDDDTPICSLRNYMISTDSELLLYSTTCVVEITRPNALWLGGRWALVLIPLASFGHQDRTIKC